MANVIRKGQGAEGRAPDARKIHHPLLSLRDEMDRLFDSFMGAPMARPLFELDPFRRMGSALHLGGEMIPDTEVRETEYMVEITAELPGLDEKDVTVSFKDGVLSIAGEKKNERKEEKAEYHLSERSYGAFVRSFRVPETVDVEHIDAEFAKGVLTVKLPKLAETKTLEKTIPITKH